MAQVFKTFQQHFDDITGASQPGTAYSAPAGASPVVSIGQPSEGVQGGQPTQPVQQQPGIQFSTGATSGITPIYERLFNPIEKGIGQQREALAGSVQKFSTAAGDARTYEGIGAENVLSQAIRGDPATRAENERQARGFLSSVYTGPSMLDQEAISNITQALGGLQTQIGSSGGIQDLIRQTTPGLTPGQVRFEAGHLRGDPNFQSKLAQGQSDISRLYANLGVAGREAETFAKSRAESEKNIAERSRGYLESERGDILGQIQKRIEEEKAQQAQAQAAWDQFYGTGALEDLQAVNQTTGATQDLEPLKTDFRAKSGEAKAALDAILARYPDIKDVPLMQMGITSHGRQTLRFPDEWFATQGAKYSPSEMAAIKERARLRQGEIDPLFSPRDATTPYQLYAPSYFMGARTPEELQGLMLQPEDLRLSASFDPGMLPAAENISTEDQRSVYNQIQNILGEVERLSSAGEPFRAASLALDLDGYFDREIAVMEKRKTELPQLQRQWLATLKRARHDFKKARKKAAWGKINRAFFDVGMAGTNRLFGQPIESIPREHIRL